jgi:hypothetical protein
MVLSFFQALPPHGTPLGAPSCAPCIVNVQALAEMPRAAGLTRITPHGMIRRNNFEFAVFLWVRLPRRLEEGLDAVFGRREGGG